MSNQIQRLRQNGYNLAPTMAFIDPFGYSDIRIQVLVDILNFRKCELLITYMVGFLDRFASDMLNKEIIKKSFLASDTELNEIIEINDVNKRKEAWLRLLITKIKNRLENDGNKGLTLYTSAFCVRDRTNNIMYYLVHFTKSLKGLEVMKESMWKVGREGEYTFSDFGYDPNQTSILDYATDKIWIPALAKIVYEHFTTKTVTASDIERYVLLNTPYIWRKETLAHLERSDKIKVLTKRSREFTYPNDAFIQFA
ncbi:hypothetical protein B9Q06_09970 [Candidatus Marsarchaeota G2 archaeon ECH_B_2]|uniref:Three-Cys-motif partner protein TcmP n=3 Tax=Candidatus Marsarchaeota group 2 TaxID=2203771 RepID=A0A2R6B6C0_9ARCH|nr:MAG: hypothetical protein B9Q06_09970 [Candidatus Marsarchaeota G2 archaeon ECH_B_2]PSN98733.1 MAG: hypothetical protein B9Q07_08895 [Candidatus Marsarchaeota G2 archaeon ECH_B_3]PSO00668.1 MAG: hypothetical protein B9Q05_10165 [Candidatus Marsarchaeota G2 archaeon ECH_B_1]